MTYLFATGIYPPEIGGPATVIYDAVTTLEAEGATCSVVTYGEERPGVIAVSRLGNVLSRYFRFAKTLRAKLKPEDVVVASDVFSVGIPTRLALIGRKNRLVLRLGGEWAWEDAVNHGKVITMRGYWQKPTDPVRFFFKKMVMAWVMRRAEKIVVTSEMLREPLRLLSADFATRCVVMPNVHGFQTELRREGAVHSPIRLLYIGRFAPVKHVVFLADVCRMLLARGVEYQLTIVGSGPDEAKIRTACEGLNVEFLPPVKYTDASRLYMENDLHLLPSLSDISPNTVAEALSVGLPCLVTSEHGLPRPLAGVLECDPLHADFWAEEIRKLTDPETYETLQATAQPIALPTERLQDVLRTIV